MTTSLWRQRILGAVTCLACLWLPAGAQPLCAGQRNEPLMHRNGVPLSQVLKDPRATGSVVVILKDTHNGPELVMPGPPSEAAAGGKQLEWMASVSPIALVVHINRVESRLTGRQDWILSDVRATIEAVIKQPPTESLSTGQRIEFQQDGGELTIDGRRVRGVIPYSNPHVVGRRYLVFAQRNPGSLTPLEVSMVGPAGWLNIYEPTSYLISSAGRLESLCAGPICMWPHSENGVELSAAIRRITGRKNSVRYDAAILRTLWSDAAARR